MRWFVAIAVSVFLTILMFAYIGWMSGCAGEWGDNQIVLTDAARMAVSAAYFLDNFWYMVVPLIFAVPLAIAAIGPRKKQQDRQGSL
jgi:hypothetical protein